MADQPTIPSSPKPQIADLIAAGLRAALIIAGAIGLYKGTVDNATITLVAGALADVVGLAWVFYEQWRQAQHVHAAAVASARSASARRYPAYAKLKELVK